MKKREEIAKEYQWRMEDLYENHDAWEQDFLKLQEGMEVLKGFAGTAGESSEQLKKLMQCCDELNMLAENVYVYANQRMHENTADSYYQGLAGRAQMLLVQLSEAASFIEPEILGIPEPVLMEMIEKEEGLWVYRTYFTRLLRRKAHI